MPLTWSKQYCIGMDEIDNQHQKLVMLINRLELLAAACNLPTVQENPSEFKNKARRAIDDLVNYTVLHFSVEEVLMSMFGYPDQVTHKATHARFVKMVEDKGAAIEKLLNDDKIDEACIELKGIYEFLTNWLLGHIVHSDREYVDFFLRIKEKAKSKGGWLKMLGG